MKNYLILLLLLIITLNLKSQSDKRILFGPKIGFNMPTVFLNEYSHEIENTFRPNFNVGIVLDIPFKGTDASFQPSLTLCGKGAKYELKDANADGLKYMNIDVSPYFIDLNLNLVYNILTDENIRLFLGGGMYLSYNLFGKVSVEYELMGETEKMKYEYDIEYLGKEKAYSSLNFSYLSNMNRYDIGLNLTAGMIINRKFYISANYQLGLLDIHDETIVDTHSDDYYRLLKTHSFGKNRMFSFSVGIFFD